MIVVVPREADQLEVHEVKLFSDEKLADYEVPKRVKIVDELPRTPYGKADKHASRDPCWEETQGRNKKRTGRGAQVSSSQSTPLERIYRKQENGIRQRTPRSTISPDTRSDRRDALQGRTA